MTGDADGVAKFLADLARIGIEAAVDGPAVIYEVMPPAGARAGTALLTGVNTSELASWPAIAPHWLHFKNDVSFLTTNPDPNECLEGWTRHSRDAGAWDMNRDPAYNWLAHILGVTSEVIS